ncbi:DUF3785 domain-containing protein [Clostridium sp. MSJ-4]|uniref:DUF3785 domain-containing protein n=1 Tax=Clostridium simiarum TaxID=2841506 RepID=A0ABS6EZ10_9CLOT|nr:MULTISPECIES: DUF3785 family protein [Clostridium]MBU5591469.1 DUF3785 domain-containing protein [Clostridium simiarum]
MDSYKFVFRGKTYELSKDNCSYLINDEENEVKGIEISDVLELLNQYEGANFDLEYYNQPCEKCFYGKEEKLKHFNFLEYHFYVFTKEDKYIISNISKEYENTSFTRLLNLGKVDNSYIVIIMVCENCGAYSIEIEQCDM